jgi:hypothetical protein
MLNNQIYYHGIIRKAIVGFGALFSDIYIDRKQGDSVNGETLQRIQIPLAYAPKEKWIVRLDQDPNLQNNVYVSLPRMSFEIIGYNYDSSRKLGRTQKITCGDATGTQVTRVFSPVPYNVDLSLYILTKTQEDGLQIVEQILPTFTPEYTLPVKVIPEMNITQDIPVILNSVAVSDEYEGDFQSRRFVTHTLNFQMKINLFGPINSQGVISTVNSTIGLNDVVTPNRIYVATGDPVTTTIIDQHWTDSF